MDVNNNESIKMKREVSVHKEVWPLEEPFEITDYLFKEFNLLIVEIKEGSNTGKGEAAGVYYLNDTVDTAFEQAKSIMEDLQNGLDRKALQDKLPPGGARNAIDCALWDLECKIEKKTIWEKTNIAPKITVTAHTIGVMDTPEMAGQKALEMHDKSLLKIKLNGKNPIDHVRAIRNARPDARLFVDANQGFTYSQLLECIPEFKKCGIEMIEQPLPRGEDAILEGLTTDIPLGADESCLHRGELEAAARRYQTINIKLDKTGGLTEALLLAEEIRTKNLDIMVGNMGGTSLAMAPGFVVAQMCQLVDLDGPSCLSFDRLRGLPYVGDKIELSNDLLWG